MNVSVVLVTYRRLKSIGRLVDEWLKETPDVWLCDCSVKGVRVNPKAKIVRACPDPGNKIRHAAALMTTGDLVIKADDDICPRPGIVKAFVEHAMTLGPAIYGIHGRKFRGPDYYHNTKLFGSKSIPAPTPVDFVGVMTCSVRQYLPMDLRDCHTEVEDLYWQMKCYPRAKKFVIVTDKFHNLQESKDKGRLCGTPASRFVRNSYYKDYYLRNYK